MNWSAIDFDWNQVKAFLATVDEGSLSAAARVLGLTQPTLSRQVTSLEQKLQLTLFERGHRSMELTASGVELLEHVRAMGEAATLMSLVASGQSQQIEGQVSITTTNVFATYHMPSIIKRLQEKAPSIEVEIIASNEIRDLRRREADIAIRHVRPEHVDLIAKKLTEVKVHFYGSRDFIDTLGRRPVPIELLPDLNFIGFDNPETTISTLQSLGVNISRNHIKVYTTSGTAIIALLRAGLGISALTEDIAPQYPELEQVFPDLPSFTVPVWLVTHQELRTSPRIRLVFDTIADYFLEQTNKVGL